MAIFSSQQLNAIQSFRDNALKSLSTVCKIWYVSEWITCPNPECLPVGNLPSMTNIGIHGGPLPTLCPLCAGNGKIQQEVTDTINLEINWIVRLYGQKQKIDAPNTRLPYDYIEVKGFLSDLPKLQKMVELQAIVGDFPVTNARYRLDSGDGFDSFNIIQGRYFMAILERIS